MYIKWHVEATHCHLICFVYIKGHAETVDTKHQSNAIVYWVWYLFCWHCWYEDQSMQYIECYVCWNCQHWCLWLLNNTVYRVMRSENCTLLCIKWPLTPAKREGYLKSLPSCGFSCSPVQGGSFVKRSLSCIDNIDIYNIDGVVEKPSVSAFQNFLQIKNWLNIKKVMERHVWMCFVLTVST